MSDIYTFLQAHKGLAYTADTVKKHAHITLLVKYPTIPAEKNPKGNSRVAGDISFEDQKVVIDLIISTASRHGLDYPHIAYALLMCKTESGFNPDAAAGTSSAGGLAQYTAATVDSAENATKEVVRTGKDHQKRRETIIIPGMAQKYLGFDLDMHGMRIFDATLGANAVVLSVLQCRDRAHTHGKTPDQDDYWQTLYGLHHDGLYSHNLDSGDWSDAAVDAYTQNIGLEITLLTQMLKSTKVETIVHLTGSDGKSVVGKRVVLASVNTRNKTTPAHASSSKQNKKIQIEQSVSNGDGHSSSITTGIGDEIIMLLLPKNFKDLAMSHSNQNTHIVKQGETLTSIAKQNDTTVSELTKDNQIKNPNDIRVGQLLKLPHQPEDWVLDEIMNQLGFIGGNTKAFSYMKNTTAQPKGSNSKSTNKSKVNAVEIRATRPAASVNRQAQQQPIAHTTNPTNAAHAVIVLQRQAPWMPIAEQEFHKHVIRHHDRTSDPNIVKYFTATSLHATTDKTAYCAAFVNWCLEQTGVYHGNNSAGALSLATWGRPTRGNKPAYGAVAVIHFPEGGHHVTFATGTKIVRGILYLTTLGGNQGSSHQVSHSSLPMSWVKHFRYPINYSDINDDYLLNNDSEIDGTSMSYLSTH